MRNGRQRLAGVGMASFEEFANTRLSALLRMATAICNDPILGEDVLQEVLIKAHRHWSHIQDLDRPESYLRRMLVNEFVSQRRRSTRMRPTADLPDAADPADPTGQQADREALRLEIERLPRRQQVVLALRYYGGLSDAEIAETLDCPPGTVRSLASRALATLRITAVAGLIGSEEVAR